jgi:peptide chain release factor 2
MLALNPLAQAQAYLDEINILIELSDFQIDLIEPDVNQNFIKVEKLLSDLEFQTMFHHPFDSGNAFMEIQSGSGGTEAQDWAEMLWRMYRRWFDKKGFSYEILDYADGDVAGMKGVNVKITGPSVYGQLRTESGVHRLVRKSPFDSGNRRHTSFAAIFITPELDDDIEVTISPADLRIDTYRASGAGGQHVNRTDSAIRITHLPTGIVVQCQSDRSQHKNRAQAMKQLQAKLYDLEQKKKDEKISALNDQKSDITWGAQVRSYILDDARIKDLRSGYESTNTQAMLDGDLLDNFIQASLLHDQNPT